MRDYDPLSVDELGRNAARALMDYAAVELPPEAQFDGAGVYTIHYSGAFAAYAGLRDDEPIYVGKADLPGRRQGRRGSAQDGPVLYGRLSEHAASIRAAENLDVLDFQCRWLVLDPVWIGLTEQVLISQCRPIWNAVVDGFGNHDPGRGRRGQKRSLWDTLHPGRGWAGHLQDREETAASILSAIARHRAQEAKA